MPEDPPERTGTATIVAIRPIGCRADQETTGCPQCPRSGHPDQSYRTQLGEFPEEVRANLFRERGNVRLLLIVSLSLYFIPWELLSDGKTFLAERGVVTKGVG